MAGELQFAYGTSGRTVYAVVRTTTGTVWNGTAFAAFNAANWSTYAVSMTEQGASGYYVGNFPAVSAGLYFVEVRDRAGGSPAVSDPVAGSGEVEWDGAAVVPLSSRSTLVASDIITGTALNSANLNAFGLDYAENGQLNASVQSVVGGVNVTQIAGSGPVDGLLNMSLDYNSFGRLNANVAAWRNSTPNSLVSGRVDASVGAMAADTVTSDAVAASAVTEIQAGLPASVAAAVLAAGDIDGYTLEQTLKLCLAALAGKLSGAATTTVTIRAADDSKNRIVATVDVDGNRSAVTLDAAG